MYSYLSPTCSSILYFDLVEEMEIVKKPFLDGMGLVEGLNNYFKRNYQGNENNLYLGASEVFKSHF